ncbi:MAG: hypothetical protein IT438_00975 [Phycisphaerales bacterium]|nr:hypothetical protein [Phycisphaerales bacterium]
MTKTALLLCSLPLALGMSGCLGFRSAGGDLTFASLDSGRVLAPTIATAIYGRTDANTADLYFSDLPEDRLTDPRDPLGGATGSLLHIHYFLNPDAGRTPIDNTACNVTIKHFVFAGGELTGSPIFGVYGGGGFFFPSGEPGSNVFGGSIEEGTHRLLAATPGFNDLLGPSEVSGKMLATRDDDAADLIGRKVRQLLRRVPVVVEPVTKPDAPKTGE